MTLVLLHPIGLDTQCWRFARIPQGVALDLPGFGEQPLPPGGLHLAEMADEVTARCPQGQLDLVGVSLGAIVAMHIGLRHGHRVRSLVLAGSTASSNPKVMQERALAVRNDGLESQIVITLDRWFSPSALADPNNQAVRYARERLQGDSPESIVQGWLAIAEHDLAGRLGELRFPATVIAGLDDKAAAPEGVRALAAGLPQANLVEMIGPHMMHMECADQFRQVVLDHMAKLGSA